MERIYSLELDRIKGIHLQKENVECAGNEIII